MKSLSCQRRRVAVVIGAAVIALSLVSACAIPRSTTANAPSTGPSSPAATGTAPTQPERSSAEPAPDAPPQERDTDLTVSQREAVESATSYLNYSAFSRTGLINQLEFEGFSTADATFAVDSLNADWNEQAALSAEQYLEYSAFSRSGLIDQLVFEGFTRQQATYGADRALSAPSGGGSGSGTTAGQRNATKSAQQYLEYSAFSRSGLINQLEFEGYSTADATYAVDSLNVDWNEQAARSAEQYLEYSSFSRSGLIDQLVFEGFTRSQAEYGVSRVGL